jgi:hypothetical protein
LSGSSDGPRQGHGGRPCSRRIIGGEQSRG